MPRRSAASYGFPLSVQERIQPPVELSDKELSLFAAIVADFPAEHFKQSDATLLTGYVRAVLSAQEADRHLACGAVSLLGKLSPWLTVKAMADKSVLAYARQLRLSPMGRRATITSKPGKPARQLSYYEEMELERRDGE